MWATVCCCPPTLIGAGCHGGMNLKSTCACLMDVCSRHLINCVDERGGREESVVGRLMVQDIRMPREHSPLNISWGQ